MNTKSVSITHLVFGLIFLGATALWVVGATTDVEAPALAVWGPVVLIGAGLVGLGATIFNARAARNAAALDRNSNDAPEYAETGVVDNEEQS
jgi:threonine dehydrogenase-like Zn-dependent dehydrogenase